MAAQVVIEAIKAHVASGKGLIFDGTPRTQEEARLVDAFFGEQSYGKPLAIYLRVDQNDMQTRNSQRKFCLGINGDFPVVTEDDVARCESLGGTVGTRPDDEATKMDTRWNEFMNQTFPVIERYLQEGVAREVNGKQPIEKVHEDVMAVIVDAGYVGA